jgi:hypothetical protein
LGISNPEFRFFLSKRTKTHVSTKFFDFLEFPIPKSYKWNQNMFIIKANFADNFEVNSSLEKTQNFFSDGNNYVELMPNLDSIHTDGRGITRWVISAEIPFVGKMKQSFAVDFLALDDRIEWHPSPVETQNYLRCMAEIIEKSSEKVLVRYTQYVELRRKKASELHPLAGLAGEQKISQGMQSEVEQMLRIFISKSKEKLER